MEEKYGAHNYHPLDVVIERAEGVWVYDVEGKRYLDALAGIARQWNTDPAEAERLHGLAEQAVDQRWDVYEEMATRDAQHYAADARRDR